MLWRLALWVSLFRASTSHSAGLTAVLSRGQHPAGTRQQGRSANDSKARDNEDKARHENKHK